MSTKEKLMMLIDGMTDEQMNEVVFFIQNGSVRQPSKDIVSEIDALYGIFHDAADPDLIPFEKKRVGGLGL